MRHPWLIAAGLLLAIAATGWLALHEEPPTPALGTAPPEAASSEWTHRATSAQPAPESRSLPGPETRPASEPCPLDPDALDYRRARARQQIPLLLEGLEDAVAFIPGEQQRLVSLLVEQAAERAMPLEVTCRDEAQARRVRAAMEQRHREQLTSFLGVARMVAFDEFERSQHGRRELLAMEEALATAHLPLSDAQRSALRESLLRPNALAPRRDYSPAITPSALHQELEAWLDYNDESLSSATRGVLSEPQRLEYARYLAERRAVLIASEFHRAGVELPATD